MNKILIHRDSLQEVRDKKYGLPELKKYPMPDVDHVRSAIRFFNYVEPHNEEKLAKAILNRMKEYGMTFDEFTVGKENRFSKYIPESHLEHHGILGQKWGEENGPPYPLDYDSHSTTEKQKNPDSKIGGGSSNGAMSMKEISNTLGFDLSKYKFQSVFSKDGIDRNVERNFQMFGFSVKELIAQQGEAGAIAYLQSEWGFSKEDAESAVKNLDKVWQDHTIKDTDDKDKKSSKKSSSKSGSSQKATKTEQKKEEEKSEEKEEKKSEDASENQYAVEYLTKIDENYDKFKEAYETLDQTEKDLLSSEWEVEDAEGYAQHESKKLLKEEYNMSDEVAEAIVMVYSETVSEAKESAEKQKEVIELVSKVIEASDTIDLLSELKDKKIGLTHSEIGDAYVQIYLAHHGIEGQKWGVTNGPPYPLDYDDHSAAEKQKNPKSELDNYGSPKQQSFFQRHKKAIIVGGAIATVAAVAIGSNYIKTKRENQRLSDLLEQTNKKKDAFDPDEYLKKIINPNKPAKEVFSNFDKAKEQLALPSSKSSGKTKEFFKTVFSGWENPFTYQEPSKAAKTVESKLTEVFDVEIIEPNNSYVSRGSNLVQRIQSSISPLMLEDKQMKE